MSRDNRFYYHISLKQVDNGYVLNVADQNTYGSNCETVYRSVHEAIDALHLVFTNVQSKLLLPKPDGE